MENSETILEKLGKIFINMKDGEIFEVTEIEKPVIDYFLSTYEVILWKFRNFYEILES